MAGDVGPFTELSLFTGYGGFTLGLRLAGVSVQTVCYVEFDPYCQRLIVERIKGGWLDDAPLWDDVRTFDGRPWCGHVDLLTAGFPCQPHSVAGQRRGEADDRNLWPDTLRVIRDVGPRFALLENVPGLLASNEGRPPYVGTVVGQLSEVGYDCIWDCIPAAALGAPHLRWRWWCLAYAPEQFWGRQSQRVPGSALSAATGPGCADVADAKGQPGALRPAEGERQGRPASGGANLANSNGQRQTQLQGCGATTRASKGGQNLVVTVGGQLNPRWVEWLMGLPIGWVSLELLATESYQQWSRSF